MLGSQKEKDKKRSSKEDLDNTKTQKDKKKYEKYKHFMNKSSILNI
jgi:hypothetical protein